MEFYLKLFFGLLAILSAFSVWWQKDVIKSAFSFLATMLAVTGLFVLEGADFVAAIHLVVYVGGVVILLLFGLMFVQKQSSTQIISDKQYRLSGISIAVLLFVLLTSWMLNTKQLGALNNRSVTENNNESTIDVISRLFLTDYILFFELGGVLLTVALLGVAVLVGDEVSNGEKN